MAGSVAAGALFGRYRVTRPIGAGGMGEVYEAIDETLGRRVALKILPADRATDPARVERFIREARMASALNHPAIVSIYDSGVEGCLHFVAMELIEGETLALWSRAARDRAATLELLARIADGLARAHAAGIVHRDLKPENVVIARGGYPKIVDFGVAKLTERLGAWPVDGDTAPSSILGTAGYMSPEQVEGRAVDARSDIFSFGSLVHAVCNGRSPFARAAPVETMHAILHDEASPAAADSPELSRIVRRCLMKDPEERYQSIRDVALDLRDLAREGERIVGTERVSRRWAIGAVAAVPLLVVLGMWIGGGFHVGGRPAVDTSTLLAQQAPPQVGMLRVTNSGNVGSAAISPDGRYLVFSTLDGELQTVWVKQLATDALVKIVPPAPVYYFDFKVSHDNNYVFYAAAQLAEPNVADIFQVPILGGPSRKIAADIDGWFTLSPDGRSVAFRRFNAVKRDYVLTIADIESGSEHEALKLRHPEFIGALAWTPDGAHLTFVGVVATPKRRATLFDLDLATGRRTRIEAMDWPGIGSIEWLPDGSGIVANAFDQKQPPQVWFLPRNGAGAPRKITSDIGAYNGITVTADSKALVATRSDSTSNLWVIDADHPEKARAVTTGTGNYFGTGGVRWLPSGDILFTAFVRGMPMLNVTGPNGGDVRSLTRGTPNWDPTVSPDGRRLAFVSDRSGAPEIWTSDINGTGATRMTHGGTAGSPSWFPDGSLCFAISGNEQTAWKLPAGSTTPERLTDRPVNLPTVSPDGTELLCRLRSLQPGTKLWQTALYPLDRKSPPRLFDVPRYGGGPLLRWMPDGRAFLFADYYGGVGNIWYQALDGSPPRQLTRFDSGRISDVDVSRDGRRIVVSRGERVNDVVLIRDFR
ncbi:MAG: serine/threonine protein kinase [Acidobacteria bacterium]|nr:serine/threonine protein kinase [Acidobacteriota bacterium]